MKKRIAVIGLKGLPAFGGAASVGENVINELKEKYDFTVYSVASHTDFSTGSYNGFKQIVFKEIRLKKLNVILYYLKSALHSLFIGDYALIHLHHRDASFILLFLKIKYKTLLTTHGLVQNEKWQKFDFLFKIQDRLFFRFADFITCPSLKDQRIINKLKIKKNIYIPNGINNNFSKINSTKKKDYIMFAAGRILPSKGCHLFLESLNKIAYDGKIVIAGDLEQMPSYKKYILNLTKNLDVKFIGLEKDKKKLFNLIFASKFFVYPSFNESMSMMLLEVASLKTPLICSDIRENRDIFSEDEVLFFKTNDVNDLSEKIRFALKNEKEIYRKADKAYDKLIENHNWSQIAEKYDYIYQQLL